MSEEGYPTKRGGKKEKKAKVAGTIYPGGPPGTLGSQKRI